MRTKAATIARCLVYRTMSPDERNLVRLERRDQPKARFTVVLTALHRWATDYPSWPYWFGLVLSFVLLYRRLPANRATIAYWFNSDYLFAADIYKDVFVDHFPLRGINFSSATGLFPDVVVTSCLMFLTNNAVLASFLYGMLQFAILTWAYILCARVVLGRPAGKTIYMAAVGLVLYTACILQRFFDPIYGLFLGRTHAGCFATVILAGAICVWLCFRSFREGRTRTIAGLMGVIAMLSMMSDPLFIPQMLVPLTLAVLILKFLNLVPYRSPWLALLVLWAGSLAGLILARMCFEAAALDAQAVLSADRFTAALNVYIKGMCQKFLSGDWLQIAVGLWVSCAAIVVLHLVRRHVVLKHRFGEMTEGTRRFLAMSLFLMLASVCSALNVVVMGVSGLSELKDYSWSIHYQFPLFYGSVFGLALLLDIAVTRFSVSGLARLRWLSAAAVVATPLVLLFSTPRPAFSLYSYRPDLVEKLDAIAPRYGLKYGLGGYWEMRMVNLFSRAGLRLYPIRDNFEPHHWMSNKYWYAGYPGSRYPCPVYTFLLLSEPTFQIPRDAIVKRFGEPAAEVAADGARILIYNRPSDEKFRNIFACDLGLSSLLRPLDHVGDRREWLGSCLPGHVGHVEKGSRVARKGEAAPDYLSYGPYLALKPGTYRATMQITAIGGAGQQAGNWDLVFYGQQPIAKGTVMTGASQITDTFDVTPSLAGKALELRMIYSGNGNLAVHKLVIEKLH